MNLKRNARILAVLILTLVACRRPSETLATTEARQVPPAPRSVSAQRQTPVVVAVHNVLPSVVNIQTESRISRRATDPFHFFFGGQREYRTESVGSGFVWASDGIIVTNAHVIEGASAITAKFADGRELEARVIGVDPDSDLAVLEVDARNLPAAPVGTSSDLLIGETVIAVGNPFGLSGSVTTGVLSATGRSVPSQEQERVFTDFLQTDASINPGNSGGPLLNIEGKVIGINTAIYANAQGIGFAIPVDRARKIVEDLRRFGEVQRAWIGAVTATITPEEARRLGLDATRGALVVRIFGESPADRSGLRVGDVIVGVGEAAIDSREAFSTITSTAVAGSALRLRVQRNGRPIDLTLRPEEPPRHLGADILREISGLTLAEQRGALVIVGVDRGSRGQQIGLQPGDVIVGMNGREVRSLRDLESSVVRSADRSSIVLAVARGRFIYNLTFPLGIGRL